MAISVNSRKKIAYFEGMLDAILATNIRMTSAVEDLSKDATTISFAAINRAYNSVASMSNKMNDAMKAAAVASDHILEELTKDTFAGQDRVVAARRAKNVAEEVISKIREVALIPDPDKGGMDDQLTTSAQVQVETHLTEFIGARRKLIDLADEITRKNTEEDFQEVYQSIGSKLETVGNDTVDDYNKLSENLAAVHISIKSLQDKAVEATAAIDTANGTSINTDLSGACMDV
ncbi:MAG: hypothetical protein RSC43_00435 [Clostridia bacterium]